MLKRLFLLLSIPLTSSIGLLGQDWEWHEFITTQSLVFDETIDVAVDTAGNTYSFGSYQGSITFEDTMFWSSQNMFLAKHDSNGNFIWAENIGGNGGTEFGRSVEIDANGDVLLTGGFREVASFGTIELQATSTWQDCFIAKYDKDGNPLWAKNITNTPFGDLGYGVTSDQDNNVYVSGVFNDAVINADFSLPEPNLSDFFIVKYDASGNFQWVNHGTVPDGYSNGMDVAVAENGEIYLAGYMRGNSLIIDGEHLPVVTQNAVTSHSFIIKLSNEGAFQWGDIMDVALNLTYPMKLSTDANNQCLLAQRFSDTLNFHNETITGPGYGIALIKFDSYGNRDWVNTVGYVGSSWFLSEFGMGGVAIDASNNVIVSGTTNQDLIIEGDTISFMYEKEGFFLKYSASGIYSGMFKGGMTSRNIAIDGNDLYTIGNKEATYPYSFGDSTVNLYTNFNGCTLAKYTFPQTCQNAAPLLAFPNPSSNDIHVVNPTCGVSTLELVNYLGQVVERQECAECKEYILNKATLGAGVYILRLSAFDETVYETKVVFY